MIDLMGNITYDDATIGVEMQRRVAVITAAQREQINARGTAAEKKELAKFFKGMTAVKIQIIADRDLLRATLAHEAAVTRIAEPALNPLAKDAGGNLLYPDVPSSSITAKGKLVSTTVTNPAIVRDTDERKAAQATIKAATPEVVALYTKRDAARVAAVKINAV